MVKLPKVLMLIPIHGEISIKQSKLTNVSQSQQDVKLLCARGEPGQTSKGLFCMPKKQVSPPCPQSCLEPADDQFAVQV